MACQATAAALVKKWKLQLQANPTHHSNIKPSCNVCFKDCRILRMKGPTTPPLRSDFSQRCGPISARHLRSQWRKCETQIFNFKIILSHLFYAHILFVICLVKLEEPRTSKTLTSLVHPEAWCRCSVFAVFFFAKMESYRFPQF